MNEKHFFLNGWMVCSDNSFSQFIGLDSYCSQYSWKYIYLANNIEVGFVLSIMTIKEDCDRIYKHSNKNRTL